MKGKFSRILLEAIGDAAVASADLLEAFLGAGYGASYGKLSRELRNAERRREEKSQAAEEELRLRQRYYNILSWLRRDGFIVGSKGMFKMTLLGRRKLEFLRERDARALPRAAYVAEPADRIIIVAFDVPEKDRAKRNWLRGVLKSLGLRMIQKSLWLGKIKIPKEFLDDVRSLRLVECVEIFEVGRAGTLKQVL